MKAQTANADRMVVLLRETLGRHTEPFDLVSILAHVRRRSVGRRLRLWNGPVARDADNIATDPVAVEVKFHVRVRFHVPALDTRYCATTQKLTTPPTPHPPTLHSA